MVNDIVEIYGLPDGKGILEATRIARKPGTTSDVRLTGTASDVHGATFKINGIRVQYQSAALANLPNGITEGMTVRIKGLLSGPSSESNPIIVSNVRQVGLLPALQKGQYVKIEGVITNFISPADFGINGLRVNLAAGAQTEGTPVRGAHVYADDTFASGILLASRVQFRDKNQIQPNLNELHGRILSIDTASNTFTMRNGNIMVKWSNATTFTTSPSNPSSLTVGSIVYVKDNTQGDQLFASEIGPNAPQEIF